MCQRPKERSSLVIPALLPSAIFGRDALGAGIWEQSWGRLGPGLSRHALGPRQGPGYAPGWRPLCLRHAGAIPKHAPAQPGKRCQPAGSVLPTDFACSSYFPLLSLAPLREPAPGFVCFNPPCAKLFPLCGVPGFRGSGVRAALVSPSHQLSLGDVQMLPDSTWGTNSSGRFPSASLLSLPAIRNVPLVDPLLLPLCRAQGCH